MALQCFLAHLTDLSLKNHLIALEIRRELLGDNSIYIAISYNGIGTVYLYKEEYDLALEYYLKTSLILKEILGERALYVAMSYNNIGIV
ncbi:tetratricopeptide repeat protein, partial [bacterium]|nr:tetratricopeptide repeat protein [bacterium]